MKKKLGLFDCQQDIIMNDDFQKEISLFNKTITESAITLECDKKSLLPLSEVKIEKIDKENDLIIYADYLEAPCTDGASSFYDEECKTFFFAFTKGTEKSIDISLDSPYVYYDFYQNVNTFVHIYSLIKEAQEAFVRAIFGEIEFQGIMPYIKHGPRAEF